MTCAPVQTGEPFLSSLLGHVDCQAQALGAIGYQTLASPSSPLSPVLTALLTIFIALFGLRLMLGEPPRLAAGVLSIAKIGIVITLATSWSAYSTVVYDVVVDTPGQLGAAIAGPTGLPDQDHDMVQRLQHVDNAIRRLTDLGSGRNDLESVPPAGSSPADPQRAPIADDPAFGWSRVLFLSSVVGAAMAVRVTAGVLLALAPLFAGFLLFDFARGVFAGWLRALLFAVLGSLAINLLLGVQLAVMEPWLSQVLQLRQAKVVAGTAPIELLILCLMFAIGLIGSLAVLLKLAFTLHIPATGVAVVGEWLQSQRLRSPEPQTAPAWAPRRDAETPPSRAESVAQAVMSSQRRSPRPTDRSPSLVARTVAGAQSPSLGDDLVIPDFGQSLRRTKPRKSIGAAIRDSRK
ncbi:type IV secretion system protein [Brevundimonas sp. SL130]|uniref:type IV secretion system protein n=1 Tax=Brevundimonas sp. SL130 TaxID=2995143 RepID=UPI00226C82C8|nr:type IV secretion system protein [Brevundimonas sp. SL130]WAC59776.1 type IV secretion system protein [Brevundimonas sp. SL130]